MTRPSEPQSEQATGWPVDLTRSVVQVLDVSGSCAGTGFVVEQGLLVTCAHVLASYGQDDKPPTSPVTVVFAHSDGAERTARIDPQWWRDRAGADIAFLRLDEPAPAQAQPLSLGDSSGVRGHRVKAFGFPLNAPRRGHYGYGVAGDLISNDGGAQLLQLTDCTEVTEGFSGGPVVDERTGLVIGMVDSVSQPDRLGRGRATTYVTPTETLREVCADLAVTHVCPYRGLEPFTIDDAAWFCGRDRAVDVVLDRLRRDRRFLALLGPSGAGKSSLIHAGVLPALSRGDLPGSERWKWLSIHPGTDPFPQLEHAGLSGATDGLAVAARRWLDDHPGHERLVLVVDQLEELLVVTSPPQRDALLKQLVLLAEQEPAVTVVVVLRDDFYPRLAGAGPAVMRLVEQALVNIPAILQADELYSIIYQPAAAAGLIIEPGLAERIASDAVLAGPSTDPPGASAAITVLPLLQFAMTELWHHRADGRLTHHAYDRIGGVVGGLAGWCDQAYQELPATQRPTARRVITALVRTGDEATHTPPTRRRRTLNQLRVATPATPAEADSDIDTVVTALAGRRLLVTSRDPATGEPVVELVHETLIREWGLLRQWLSHDHEFLVWREKAEADCAQWTAGTGGQAGHDPDLLLRGSALEQARTWLDQRPNELSTKLADFIRLSDRTQHQRQTRDRNRVRLLATLLVVAVALGVLSVFQTNRAQQQAQLATSRSLAAQAERLADSQADLAQLLSLASLHTAPTREAWTSIQSRLSRPQHPYHQLTGHGGAILNAAFNHEGTLLATASIDKTVRLWDVAKRQPLGEPLTAHTGAASDVAFSPNGALLATASTDKTVRLWDVASRQPLGEPLTGHTDGVLGVAFSPDGTLLATTGKDMTVRLWDVASRQPLGEPLTGHTNAVLGVAFSPDGTLLATASADKTARLWDVATSQPLGEPLTGHPDGGVYGVAFSPDGTLLATTSTDKTVRLWDVAKRQPLGEPLTGHNNSVIDVAFNRDGTLLATASADDTVRLWDVASRQPLGVPLTGHTDDVYGVAFNRDGTLLATASVDRTVRLWDVASRQPLGEPLTGHTDWVYGVAFNRDGTLLATTSADKKVRLWDVASRQPLGEPLTGHTDEVYGVAFSPDGTLLATTSTDDTVRLWDVAKRQPLGEPLTGHTDDVYGVAFNRDGTLLATTSTDDTVRLWDVASRQPLGEPLTGHTEAVQDVAFSPDGTLLASASVDKTVRLWDVASRQPLGEPLTGHANPLVGVTFSPDGTLLAVASGDNTVRLWDVAKRQPLGEPLTGHNSGLFDVAFSPDGTRLATASNDHTARLWATPVTWVTHACELASRNLSQAEWDRYVVDVTPYVRQCAQFPSGVGADPDALAATYPARP